MIMEMEEQCTSPVISFLGGMIQVIGVGSVVSGVIGLVVHLLALDTVLRQLPLILFLAAIPCGLACISMGRKIRSVTLPIKKMNRESTNERTIRSAR